MKLSDKTTIDFAVVPDPATTVPDPTTTARDPAPTVPDPALATTASPQHPRPRRPTPQRSRRPTPRRLISTAAESDPATVLLRRDDCIELPSGSVVDEIYEIEAKLGAGAMGEVYAARHLKLGKRVAIKVIGQRLSEDAAAIARFAQEARALAQVQHPAIVAVDHVGELADGRAYFSMEFLLGESLHARLQRGRIPLPEALRILDQMARGLEAAHSHGVTHRDLKPENTFLVHLPSEAPLVKLVDFGLAKLQADVDRRAERTQSGVAIGTPMYMSPEQARGPDVDHRTDIYALGVVAYELLLGSVPFPHAKTAPELYAAHLHESPPLPRAIWPEIPPQLDLVLFAMLAKDREHRPTLTQVRSVLATVQVSSSQRAETVLVAPRAPKPKTNVKIAAIVAAALIGGIGIGVTLTSRPRHETPIAAPIAPVGPIAPVEPVGSVEAAVPAIPPVPTAMIDATSGTPAPRPRNTDVSGTKDAPPSRRSGLARPTAPRIGSAAIASPVSVDGGVDAATVVDPPPPTPPSAAPAKTAPKPNKPPLDRNQTVNPFANHTKGGLQ